MAVLRIGYLGDQELGPSGATRRWGKLINRQHHIDLTRPDGYAITAPFVDWGAAVAVGPGEFALSVHRIGHEQRIWLISVDPTDQPYEITAEEIAADLAEAVLPDEQRARALNSPLYAVAVYCWRHLPSQPVHNQSPRLEAARQALAALTPDERRIIAREFDLDVAPRYGPRSLAQAVRAALDGDRGDDPPVIGTYVRRPR